MCAPVNSALERKVSFIEPAQLMRLHDEMAEGLTPTQYIRKPEYQRLKDMWCAARFGMGYLRHVARCRVRVNELQSSGTDFFLEARGSIFEFQTVIADVPDRKMSDEYRVSELGRSRPYEPDRGLIEGPQWIANAVNGKIAKLYAGAANLNLLVYANFSAHYQRSAPIREAVLELPRKFSSVWVMNNHQVCSTYSTQGLGSVDHLAAITDAL